MKQYALKQFVDVIIKISKEGRITPLKIFWEGIEYEIDKVTDVRQAVAALAGGYGTRFKVMVKGQERSLYLENGKFFIEYKEQK